MKLARLFVVLTFAFAISPCSVWAGPEGDIYFKVIAEEGGLGNASVYSVTSDRLGFIWFATDNGLVRYDGYRVRYYHHQPLDTNSICDNTLSFVCADTGGSLWIGTWGSGVDRFDPQTERFIHYRHDPEDPNSLGDNRIHYIFRDVLGDIWVGTYNGGLNRYDPASDRFIRFMHNPADRNSLSSNRVWTIAQTEPDYLWIGTENGLNRFDLRNKSFQRLYHSRNNKSTLSHNRVRSLAKGLPGQLWAGTQEGFNLIDTRTLEATRFYYNRKNPPPGADIVNSLYVEPSGMVWIGTDGIGIMVLPMSRTTGLYEPARLSIHSPNPFNPKSISHSSVRYIYADASDNLWIATRGGGVNYVDRHIKKFRTYASNPKISNTLNNNRVFALYEDAVGILWIGTDGGLNRLDRKREQFTYFLYNPKNRKSIPENRIRALTGDKSGNIWVGLYNEGLAKYSPKKKTFYSYKFKFRNPAGLSQYAISCLLYDTQERLWIGSDLGLGLLDTRTEKLLQFFHDKSDTGSLSHNRVLTLFIDRDNVLWIGTDGGGLNGIRLQTSLPAKPEEWRFQKYSHIATDSTSLSNNRVFSVFEDHHGNLWIGTAGGLNLLNRATGQFTCFTENHGLPNNLVRGILEDRNGNLWISTNRGLAKFNPDTRQFRNYDVLDGLQSNEFNEGAYFKNPDGEMFFGGVHGFNVFRPEEITDNPNPPVIALTDFRRFGKTFRLPKSITYLDQLILSYRENFFALEFTALDFTNPEKNHYAYQLEGFDEDWIYSRSERTANYTNVDPGQYVFRVKGSNSDGAWNETGVRLTIIITPPFWRTWWFKLFLVAGLVLTVLGWIRWRINNIREQNKLLEAMVEKRTAELKQKKAEIESALDTVRHTQDQLIQAEKMSSLGQMVAGVAHEINTPRATVDHYVFVMNRRITEALQQNDSETLRRLFKNLVEEILPSIKLANERIGEVVEGLLNFTRVDLADFRNADLHQIINSVLVILKNLYKGRIEIIREFAQIPPIECYPGQLSQLFMNIILNAVEAIPAGGYIRITTEMVGKDHVIIRIKDTGTGMPDDVKLKIFDPFFTTKELGKGKGLGLSVCYSIVMNHSGKIEFESTLGEGTEFVITLPVNQNTGEVPRA